MESGRRFELCVGQAILGYRGEPSGRKNNSRAKLEPIRAEFIEILGRRDQSIEILARWWNTADAFQGHDYPHLAFAVSAKMPARLDAAIDAIPKGKPIRCSEKVSCAARMPKTRVFAHAPQPLCRCAALLSGSIQLPTA
jgi:hypothetical protein